MAAPSAPSWTPSGTAVLCPDVNVLVHAFRSQSPRHEQARRWLTGTLAGPSSIGLLPVVMSGFVRVVTNRRVFDDPDPVDDAIGFVDALERHPRVAVVEEGVRAWRLARDLMLEQGLGGDDVPDAFIAGTVLSLTSSLVTYDRGFHRFHDLRIVQP